MNALFVVQGNMAVCNLLSKTDTKVRLVLEHFRVNDPDAEIDGLIITANRVVVVETKSNLEKRSLDQLLRTMGLVKENSDVLKKLLLSDEDKEMIANPQTPFEGVLFSESAPPTVVEQVKRVNEMRNNSKINIVVNMGSSYDWQERVDIFRPASVPSSGGDEKAASLRLSGNTEHSDS